MTMNKLDKIFCSTDVKIFHNRFKRLFAIIVKSRSMNTHFPKKNTNF